MQRGLQCPLRHTTAPPRKRARSWPPPAVTGGSDCSNSLCTLGSARPNFSIFAGRTSTWPVESPASDAPFTHQLRRPGHLPDQDSRVPNDASSCPRHACAPSNITATGSARQGSAASASTPSATLVLKQGRRARRNRGTPRTRSHRRHRPRSCPHKAPFPARRHDLLDHTLRGSAGQPGDRYDPPRCAATVP